MGKHPGIRVHSIPAEGGPGLIFAIGFLTIFLIEIPVARLVLAVGLVGGLIMATVLRWRDRSRRSGKQHPRLRVFPI